MYNLLRGIDTMSSNFNHQGSYICECGREFENSQAFNGHKSHCKIHQINKHGSLDEYENAKKRQIVSLKKYYDDRRPQFLADKEKLELEETTKWISEKHTCEVCGKVMTEKYATGRFCSKECAHSRVYTDEKREKASESLKNTLGAKKDLRIKEYNEHPNYCIICGNMLPYDKRNSKTCSPECLSEANKLSGRQAGLRSAEVQAETRRSKNEIYFCELCENYFKEVKHNEPMFNGWDADVIIEDIKYAILWNGPWHYQEISKKQSLKQVQTRDKIKLDQIQLCGYIPYVIKDMGKENKQFVEEQFNLFLEHIAGGRSVSD